MNSLTLTLPWPDADLSQNARVHWAPRARAVKKARDYGWGMTLAAMGPLGIKRATWGFPITAEYTFHPEIDRKRDDDGLIGRMKSYRDGMARALGVDDNSFRTMPIVYGEKRKPACVVVTLTPATVAVPLRGCIK